MTQKVADSATCGILQSSGAERFLEANAKAENDPQFHGRIVFEANYRDGKRTFTRTIIEQTDK